MNRIVFAGLACVLAAVPNALALRIAIAPPPVPMRAAAASAAYVGKVTAVADKAVAADMFKGDTRQMKVATVRVSETLVGKGAREVKVGFFTGAVGGPAIGGGIRPIRPIRPPIGRMGGVQLTVGQEGVLFLNQHPTMKDVYVVTDNFGFISKPGNPNYAKELAEVKAAAKAWPIR